MKLLVKFLLFLFILLLSTNLLAQRTYIMSIQDNKFIISDIADSAYKNGIVIQTNSTPMFEFYDINSKVILGIEKKSNFNKKVIEYMDKDDGDTKIKDKLKFKNIDEDYVEFFYYSNTFISNYFTPQDLETSNYVLKINDNEKIITYNIRNCKIEKETL